MADDQLDADDDLEPPLGRRVGRWAALVAAAVAVGLIALLATAEEGTDREARTELLGETAPAVAGATLDGVDFDLTRERGRWVLVNFFQTSCVPCVREHPQLVEFARRHEAADDARVVSVTFDDTVNNVREFFTERGGDWPVVIGETAPIALDYGVVAVPESYLIGPNGQVAVKLIGGVTADGIDGFIADLTGGS